MLKLSGEGLRERDDDDDPGCPGPCHEWRRDGPGMAGSCSELAEAVVGMGGGGLPEASGERRRTRGACACSGAWLARRSCSGELLAEL